MMDFTQKKFSCTCGTVRESLLTIAGATPSIWPGRRAFTHSTGRDAMRMPVRAAIGGGFPIPARPAAAHAHPHLATRHNHQMIRMQHLPHGLPTHQPPLTPKMVDPRE